MATSETVTIGGSYWDAQLDTFDALESGEYDLVVFRTGYAGGKTLLASDWLHSVAVNNPKSDNILLAPDYQKGGPATYKTFFERLPGDDTVPAEGGDPENSQIVQEYNAVDKRITYVNGSIARLGSADKWNRYAGSEFNAIACDEPAHYDNTNLYDLVEMLTSRQRTSQGPNVMLWTSTGAGFNQYHDITERMVTQDGEPLPWADRMKVVVGSSLDNPFLPSDAEEKLRRQFEGTSREDQALHGGFASAEGLVYSQFNRQEHLITESEAEELIPDDADPIYGYDAGWDHPRVLVQLYPTHYDQWVVTDLYYKRQKPFEHLADPSNESGWVYRKDLPRGRLYSEHEPEHIQKFNKAGFNAKKAEKSLDEGIPYIRGILESKGDPARPGLLVTEDCTKLIQEFQSYKEDHVGKSSAPDHALDALRYALYTNDHTGKPGGVMLDL